jgi:hypothetical protein
MFYLAFILCLRSFLDLEQLVHAGTRRAGDF